MQQWALIKRSYSPDHNVGFGGWAMGSQNPFSEIKAMS
jgi:hypothetical protein